MKGRKHHGEHHGEHAEHHEGLKAHHRRRGGSLHEPKTADAGGNPYVEAEARKTKSIGKIGGIKSAFRGDRKCGGAAKRHADGGEAKERKRGGRARHHADGGFPTGGAPVGKDVTGGENPAERKRGGRARPHEHEGAEERKRGGGVHHKGGHDGHGMPTVHHGEGGVAHAHTHAGGHKHHAAGGAAGGADTNPYSSAGKQLRRKGGHCG